MHPAIQVSYEAKRGCGYREKKGAKYLVNDGAFYPCGRLPIPLVSCPCCGHGIKPARGWTWVDADQIIEATASKECSQPHCNFCPLSLLTQNKIGRAGLIWIGEKYYPTPGHFTKEAVQMGISRRIYRVPRGFKLNETWVLLAHRKAVVEYEFGDKDLRYTPGIFKLFKPTAIEVICDGEETEEEIEGYLRRGFTPVLVKKAEQLEIQDREAERGAL